MKIGLIDVDSHNFPNLALMKISAFEKSRGNSVEWWNGFNHYDRVYMAKVFNKTYSEDFFTVIDADEIIQGGTGYGLKDVLPNEIEHIYPDYGLYGIQDTAFGFLTRGCPRHCPFCIVGDKEGLCSHKVADLSEFWRGQNNIEIMDPNLLASKEHGELLEQLIESRSLVNFNQGLDVRFLDKETADQLNRVRVKLIHFAWDNYEQRTREKLEQAREWLRYKHQQIIVYVLTNFNTTIEQDLERIYTIREIGFDPYVMIYDKPTAPKEIKDLQRWVNNRFIFRSCEWSEYKKDLESWWCDETLYGHNT
jgi:hypothetical protein